MNYKKIYLSLMKKRLLHPAKSAFQYTENHHILPVSIYPQKQKNKKNIVNLSARQHYIAHLLLVKYYKKKGDKQNYYKMLSALTAMSQLWGSNRSNELRYKCGNRKSYLYQLWKEELSKYIKQSGCRTGINSSNYNKKMIHNEKLKQIKYINKDEAVPEGWQLGQGSWLIKAGSDSPSYNRVWYYDKITNQQYYFKKQQLEQQLQKNKNLVLGHAPNKKTHIQHFNPLSNNRWISNLQLKECKLLAKKQKIPEGWLIGKLDNFDIYLEKYNLATAGQYAYFVDYERDFKKQCIPQIRLSRKLKEARQHNKIISLNQLIQQLDKQRKKEQLRNQEKINLLRDQYKVYCEKGFDRCCVEI